MSFDLLDPRTPLLRGKGARWWTSHGGRVLHQYWCRYLLAAPGVAPRPKMEGRGLDEVLTQVPRSRRCGWCCDQGLA